MSDTYKPLIRSEINKLSGEAQVAFCLDKQPTYEFALARAVEAAATAPLLARIAELERELADASKDAGRWRKLKTLDWYVGPGDFYCDEAGGMNDYMDHNCVDLDAAIDAMKDKL